MRTDHKIREAFQKLSDAATVDIVDTSNILSINRATKVKTEVKVFDSETFYRSIEILKEYLNESIIRGVFESFEQEDLNLFTQTLSKLSNFEESFSLPFDVHQFANLTIYKYLKTIHEEKSNRPHSVCQNDALDEMLIQQFAVGKYRSCESLLNDMGELLVRKLYEGKTEDFFVLRSLLRVATNSGWLDMDDLLSMYDIAVQKIMGVVTSFRAIEQFQLEDFYCKGELLRAALSAADPMTRKSLVHRIEKMNQSFVKELNTSNRQIAKILKAELRGFTKSLNISSELSKTRTGAILEIAIQGAGRYEYEHTSFGLIGYRSKYQRQQFAIASQKLNPTRLSSCELLKVANLFFDKEKADCAFSSEVRAEILQITKIIVKNEALVHDPSTNVPRIDPISLI